MTKKFFSYLDFIGSVGLVDFFSEFLAVVLWVKTLSKMAYCHSHYLFPVAVDLGWASCDDIEGTIPEPAYIMYGKRLPCGSFLRRLES